MLRAPEAGPSGAPGGGGRIATIDLWRGFALFGVCVVNFVNINARYLSESAAAALASVDIDWKVERLMGLLLANKSNTLFTFLFGIGFAILMERAAADRVRADEILIRRMIVLTAIGLIHLLALFNGDLLHVYGICGLLLLLLRRLPDRVLFVLGLCLALFARLLYEEWRFVAALFPGADTFVLGTAAEPAEMKYQLLHEASALELIRANMSQAIAAMLDVPRKLAQATYFFGRMLIGFAFWRSGLCRRVIALRGRQLATWLLVLGVASAVLTATTLVDYGPSGTLRHFLMNLLRHAQILVLSAFYLLALVAVSNTANLRWFALPIQQLGRMSLTNYLLQSVAMVALLYGPGSRLAGDIGPAVTAALATLVYVAQVAFSTAWLKYHAMGPAEWFWRRLARPRLRTQQSVA